MTEAAGREAAGGSGGHDPALDELRRKYQEGNLVLFVGAGVSAAAGLPGWGQLVDALAQRARARGADAARVGDIGQLTAAGKYIDALTAARDAIGAPEFGEVVEASLDDRRVPEVPEVGRAIAALAPKLRAVLTTNLDNLLERAFEGRWPVLHRAPPDVARRQGVILKLHGTLFDRSTWVLTRDQYDRAMYADPGMKDAFAAIFLACPILFVGYGLVDDDFDQLLGRVRALAGGQPPRHYALVLREQVTPYSRKLREDAGVRVIPYTAHADVPRILRWLAAADAGAPVETRTPAVHPSASATMVVDPPPSLPLPPPPDAPYDPQFYIRRPDEERRALAKLTVAGSPVVLWAPERFGKSTMLRYLLERVEEEDTKLEKEALVIEADLGALLPEPSSGPPSDAAIQARMDAFLGRFAHHLLDEVRAGEAAFAAIARDRAGWADKLRYLMEDHVLPRARGRLVLVLDKADALWGEPKLQGAFYAALRVWKERAQAGRRGWSSFRLVLLLSTTPALVFEDPEHRDSTFSNLTADVIELRDLSPDQIVDLARRHGLAWSRDAIERHVLPLLGGHPYLLRVLMFEAWLTGATLDALTGSEETLLRLYGTHLNGLGQLLDQDPALREALARVLDASESAVDADLVERLRRAGLAARSREGGIHGPCRLYERYLRRRWQTRSSR